MRTFKQLQDEVLSWGADEESEGLPRDLAKQGLNRAQQRILTSQQWDFMLWPYWEQMDVFADLRNYALHPLFGQGLYFFNSTTGDYMEEVPMGQLMEASENFNRPSTGEPGRFSLTGVTRVKNQPEVAGVVVVTANGTEVQANSFIIRGTRDGDLVSDTLVAPGSTWTTLTGTQTFDRILNVVKLGDNWTYDADVSIGTTNIVTLLPAEYGRQYRQFELIQVPSSSATILYRFFMRPEVMELDHDLPQIPEEFDELLVLDALIKLQGFTRATPDEMGIWKMQYDELEKNMNQTYRDGRTMNARPRYVQLVDRL